MPCISHPCSQGLCSFCNDPNCQHETCHFVCDQCGEPCRKLYDGLCAGCERIRIKSGGKPVQKCDNCSASHAFRNPRHRRNEYLCADCHAKDTNSPPLPERLPMATDCATYDVNDERHDDRRVRGNRFRCNRCHRDRFATGRTA